MSNQVFLGPDPVRSRLRATVANIEEAMAKLPVMEKSGEGTGVRDELAAAWADLVDQLALGPEPALRACPKCGYIGMRAGTVCSNCWSKLTPPD